MSFVSEAADGGSVSSMSDTAQDGHSSRTSASSIHQDGDLGDGSESESYVEVEQLGEDMMAGPANFTTLTAATSPARSPPCNIVRHVTKRTLITLHQRSVLEEYYRNGMTSASQQLAEVHEQVAAKTGLDLSVVRNWIRNRRRPNAAKMAEKMAEKIAQYGIPVTSSLSTTQLPTLIPSHHTSSLTPLSTLPHTVVVTATNHHHMATPGLIRVNTDSAQVLPHPPPPSMTFNSIPQLTGPEQKKICLDQSNSHHFHYSPSSPHSVSSSLLVKVRVCGSGECDFVEVEVGPLTYPALMTACCEELELATSDVAKIRKLPNILIRKDKDVQRMKDGQELELVLKNDPMSATVTNNAMSVISPPAAAASGGYSTTSMLTVNPFSTSNAAAVLALTSNQASIVQRGGGGNGGMGNEGLMGIKQMEENGMGTANHHVIPILTSDASEVQNHTHSSPTIVNGLQ